MAYPPEPKKFDAVTIIGLAVAVAILVFGQMQITKKQEAARIAAEQTQREEEDRATLKRIREEKAKAEAAATNPSQTTGAAGTPKTPDAAADKAKKIVIAPTPDIIVTGDFVELAFQSKGATIKSAVLPQADVDVTKKGQKGLEILAEIVDGKRTFGIPKIEIINKKNSNKILWDGHGGNESLDESIWAVKDTGAFDASGIRTVAYEIQLQDYTLTKTFTINKTERFVRCDVALKNGSDADAEYFYELNGPQGVLLDGPAADPKGGAGGRVTIQAQLASRDSQADQGVSNAEPEVKVVSAEAAKAPADDTRAVFYREILWGAVKNRFFMATFVSLDSTQLNRLVASPIINAEKVDDKRYTEPNIALMGRRRQKTLAPSTAQSDPYALYLGPSDDHYLDAAEADMKKLMSAPSDYHMRLSIQFFEMLNWRWPNVDRLARAMMWVFQGIHSLFGNYGIAVVLMTLLIKICLHPLQRKTMISMSKMQKLQPELNRIKKKYENVKGTEATMKMGAEQREVMNAAGVSPTAGCLPMLIQAPVFSALYGIFNHAFEMRGAEFFVDQGSLAPRQSCHAVILAPYH